MITFQDETNDYWERQEKPNYYMCSVYNIKNGTTFLILPNHFMSFEEPERTIYFSEIDNELYLTIKPIFQKNHETYNRKLQRAGAYNCQTKIPFPFQFKDRFKIADYKRIDLTRVDAGVFKINFKVKRTPIEQIKKHQQEQSQKHKSIRFD